MCLCLCLIGDKRKKNIWDRKRKIDKLREQVEEPLIIKQMRDILSRKQAKKIKGHLVDTFTASAVVQVYDGVNDANKKKMSKLPLPKMVDLVWKVISRIRK
jgi:hypothetical protein